MTGARVGAVTEGARGTGEEEGGREGQGRRERGVVEHDDHGSHYNQLLFF